MLTGSEVAKHNSLESCWLVIHGKVYDVTSFIPKHPGGRASLLRQAGADATAEFDNVHSIDIFEELPDRNCLGEIDPTTTMALNAPKEEAAPPETSDSTKVRHISTCISASDFRAEAKKVLNRRSWIYVSSSANAGLSLRCNLDDWSLLSFRPRVMRDVSKADTRAAILGHGAQFPFFVSPMGTMGMAHPNAEPELNRGLVSRGVHGVTSTASSKPASQIMDTFVRDHGLLNDTSPSRLFFQLYIQTDRAKAVTLLRQVKKAGFKGLWVTVDTPVLGKRTADRRLQAEEAISAGLDDVKPGTMAAGNNSTENEFAPAVGARPMPGSLSPAVNWEDLEWIRKEWNGPIVLKGIQCAEDARLAAENKVQGILLSNHGGRQQHTAPSALATLLEIRTYCPDVLDKLEIYVDGGCRDGADVLKALCLGATAVGFGRPFFYAMAAYGTKGVERCIDILGEELTTGMSLLGVTALDQLRPEMVNTSRLLNNMWRPELPSIQSRL